jgi:hypothetical protein
MNVAELELQITATRAFILADAEDIEIVRRTRSDDGSGGFIYESPVALAAQVARLIPQSDKVREVTAEDGRVALPEWVIMMEPDSDLQRYDRFTWRGIEWEIAQIHTKPDYQLKGDVIRYA